MSEMLLQSSGQAASLKFKGQNKMTKTQYIVYRHGSNAANQSMTQTMPVGIWEASSRSEAIDLASREVTVYNNQHLSAKPESQASYADRVAAIEADHARDLEKAELAEWKAQADQDAIKGQK